MSQTMDASWFHALEPITLEVEVESDTGSERTIETRDVTPAIIWERPFLGDAGFGLKFYDVSQVKRPEEVFQYKESVYACHLEGPRDFIAFWRAALLLRECTRVKPWFVSHTCFEAFARDRSEIHENDLRELTARVRGGLETVDRIQALSPPDWLIDRALAEWRRKDAMHMCRTLTEELRHGRLEWRDAFTQAGVLTPEQADKHEEIWKQLEPLIVPLAQRCGTIVGEPMLKPWMIRNEVITLGMAGALRVCGPFALAAVAVLASKRFAASTMMEEFLLSGEDLMDLARDADRQERKRLKQLAPWVAKRWRGGAPHHPQHVTRTEIILQELLARTFPETHVQRMQAYIEILKEKPDSP